MTLCPTVSVIVPSYNHQAYIEDAIKSVANQQPGDFNVELIVIDDGSTDGSVEFLRHLLDSQKYDFKLISKNNEGLCRTLNRGVREHATGSLIAVLASDDMWRRDKLKLQIETLRKSPDCEICYSNAEIMGSGRTWSKFLFSGGIRSILTLYNFVPAGSIIFTRRLFDVAGGFDDGTLKLEDWDFLLRASASTKFCSVKENLLIYRVHNEGSLIRMRRTGTLFSEKMKVLKKNKGITSPVLRAGSAILHFSLDRLLRPLMYKIEALRG